MRFTRLFLFILTLVLVFHLVMPSDSSGQEPNCTEFTIVGSPVQLTFNSGNDVDPSWSPDGAMIAFASNRTGNHEIYIISLATGKVDTVTSNGNSNWHPDWSPDGQLISYTGGPNSDQICFSSPDGTGETCIIMPDPARHPDWSPDGSEFAYTAKIGVEGPVRRINSDGSGTPSTIASSGWYADWAPDGNRIAFARYAGGGQIYLVDPDGSNLKNISTSGNYHAYPAWSPDGTVIACSITKGGNSEIYIIDTLGNELLQVTDSPSSSDIYPTWSPSGDAIAFHSNRSGNVDIWKIRCNKDHIFISLDIKPGSCPNALNVKNYRFDLMSNEEITDPGRSIGKIQPSPDLRDAKFPVSIQGTADFDVYSIDLSTVELEGVSPTRWNYEDVSTPMPADALECECHGLGPDGLADLILKFDRRAIIEALGDVSDGEMIPLTITGQLLDGTPFEGVDCILIRGNNKSADGMAGIGEDTPVDLEDNFPNPFNPETKISFNLQDASDVTLDVYNIVGQKVITLADGYHEAGRHSVVWDGKDAAGQQVASGIYLYRVTAGEYTETRRMVLLK
jgi:Tol biopolymer transport system component